jgi:hypothetical protein
MVRLFGISLLLFFAHFAFAQDTIDENKMVGFGCFYEGRETKIVSRFGKLLKRKRYETIAAELHSQNSAARVMAVICLERLAEQNKRSMTAEEKLLLNQIKSSKESVGVCSGCFPNPAIEITHAFNSNMFWGAEAWLDRHLGKK